MEHIKHQKCVWLLIAKLGTLTSDFGEWVIEQFVLEGTLKIIKFESSAVGRVAIH